ncbi:MAG TPA: PIN domain-containing protein [Candidatus Dormibacteraeota bacterium]|nr:PIN domain-containing protein [Candidatus Dormibacteraeota bacterium]
MSRRSLEKALPAGERVLLDSTTLIAYLNGGEKASVVAEHVVDALVKSGRNPAVVSMVTVMEILVRPRRRSLAHYDHAIDFLSNFPNLEAQRIDLAVAQEAATIRALYNLLPPDALVVATGIIGQVAHLVSNDKEWATKLRPLGSRVTVCRLDDHLPW